MSEQLICILGHKNVQKTPQVKTYKISALSPHSRLITMTTDRQTALVTNPDVFVMP